MQCDDSFEHSITTVIDEGFVEVDDELLPTLRWVHDKIVEAASSLSPDVEFSRLQYQVGEILVYGLGDQVLRDNIFIAVNLLNSGISSSLEPDKRADVARLNLRAAKISVKVSAYESASRYVSRA